MLKCVIFDMDGTLLNTLPTITYYLNVTLHQFSLPSISEDECRTYVGGGARNLVLRTLAARGVTDSSTAESFLRIYSGAYDSAPYYLTEAYPGIYSLIDELRSRGIRLAVLSNKPDFATRSIADRFFNGSFDLVHGGRDNVPLKPARLAVDMMLSELGVYPYECAYVGDSEIDASTGKNAELGLTVGVSWGFRDRSALLGADSIADTANELLHILLS
ncbi:MAG: HAD family hydrolase [Clostridia bacterium]|nr:HAD family hydrolase [Clostridia bacterium]